MKPNFKLRSSITLAGGLLLLAPCAQATQFTWDGGGADGNWNTGANWVGDTFTEAGGPEFTYLKFAGTTNLITNNNKSASSQGLNVGQIDFLAGAGAFTLNQSNGTGFYLDMLGTNGNGDKTDWAQVNNFSANAQTINLGFIARADFAQGIEFNTESGNILMSGPITENVVAGAKLLKIGNQSLTLSGNSSYTGSTTISAGILQVGNGGTTGTLGADSDTSIASGAELRINRSSSDFGYDYSGSLSGDGAVNIVSDSRFNFRSDQTSSSNLSFTVDGRLAVFTGSANFVTDVRLGALTGSGTISRAGESGGAATLHIGGTNSSSTFSGTIVSAELGIEKTGTGTLTLSGNNSYSGATTVSGGALAVNGMLSNTSGVTVSNANTRLMGTGTIGGDTTIETGAIHSPGNSVGKQTIDANLTYNNGSIFEWDLNANTSSGVRGTGYDAVDGTGTLTVDSTANTGSIFRIILGDGVTLTDAFWATPYASHTWSDIFSGFSLTGGFDSSNIEVTGQDISGIGSFTITGTSLTFTAVPEPTSALVALLLGAGLMRRSRRSSQPPRTPAVGAPSAGPSKSNFLAINLEHRVADLAGVRLII